MNKPVIAHKDKLGRGLSVNDFVAFPQSNQLLVGKIIKLNRIMVKVQNLSPVGRYAPAEYNKYPRDCVRLAAEDMTWYILKNT